MTAWQLSAQEDNLMIVYPVPVEVTQARIQLLVDQTAKAPPNTINEDLKAVYDAKSQAQQAQIRQHVEQHAEQHVEQHAQAEPAALVDVKV
jgi:hypothetical protein